LNLSGDFKGAPGVTTWFGLSLALFVGSSATTCDAGPQMSKTARWQKVRRRAGNGIAMIKSSPKLESKHIVCGTAPRPDHFLFAIFDSRLGGSVTT
jgi:hypothetical protein